MLPKEAKLFSFRVCSSAPYKSCTCVPFTEVPYIKYVPKYLDLACSIENYWQHHFSNEIEKGTGNW